MVSVTSIFPWSISRWTWGPATWWTPTIRASRGSTWSGTIKSMSWRKHWPWRSSWASWRTSHRSPGSTHRWSSHPRRTHWSTNSQWSSGGSPSKLCTSWGRCPLAWIAWTTAENISSEGQDQLCSQWRRLCFWYLRSQKTKMFKGYLGGGVFPLSSAIKLSYSLSSWKIEKHSQISVLQGYETGSFLI